jgi:hypothetical protein
LSRGIAFYLDLMDIIAEGSMTVQLHKVSNIAKLTISRDEIVVDVGQAGLAYDVLRPLIVVSKGGKDIKAVKRGEKFRSNTMLIRQFLKLFEGIEATFVEKEKVLRVRFQGKDVLVVGPEEGSLVARMAGLKKTSLPHKVHLLMLAKNFWLSRPGEGPVEAETPRKRKKAVPKDKRTKKKGFLGKLFNR